MHESHLNTIALGSFVVFIDHYRTHSRHYKISYVLLMLLQVTHDRKKQPETVMITSKTLILDKYNFFLPLN